MLAGPLGHLILLVFALHRAIRAACGRVGILNNPKTQTLDPMLAGVCEQEREAVPGGNAGGRHAAAAHRCRAVLCKCQPGAFTVCGSCSWARPATLSGYGCECKWFSKARPMNRAQCLPGAEAWQSICTAQYGVSILLSQLEHGNSVLTTGPCHNTASAAEKSQVAIPKRYHTTRPCHRCARRCTSTKSAR